MTEKFDEFEKWLKKSKYMFYDEEDDITTTPTQVFYEFHAEQKLKQKKGEILETIHQGIYYSPPRVEITMVNAHKTIEEYVYEKLMEKGMLK